MPASSGNGNYKISLEGSYGSRNQGNIHPHTLIIIGIPANSQLSKLPVAPREHGAIVSAGNGVLSCFGECGVDCQKLVFYVCVCTSIYDSSLYIYMCVCVCVCVYIYTWSCILPHIGVCVVQLSTMILVLKSKICQRGKFAAPHSV